LNANASRMATGGFISPVARVQSTPYIRKGFSHGFERNSNGYFSLTRSCSRCGAMIANETCTRFLPRGGTRRPIFAQYDQTTHGGLDHIEDAPRAFVRPDCPAPTLLRSPILRAPENPQSAFRVSNTSAARATGGSGSSLKREMDSARPSAVARSRLASSSPAVFRASNLACGRAEISGSDRDPSGRLQPYAKRCVCTAQRCHTASGKLRVTLG
jgi:hypothetical protein